jgi:hypothetical protein
MNQNTTNLIKAINLIEEAKKLIVTTGTNEGIEINFDIQKMMVELILFASQADEGIITKEEAKEKIEFNTFKIFKLYQKLN